jgi:hypothetical protein
VKIRVGTVVVPAVLVVLTGFWLVGMVALRAELWIPWFSLLVALCIVTVGLWLHSGEAP